MEWLKAPKEARIIGALKGKNLKRVHPTKFGGWGLNPWKNFKIHVQI